MAAHCALSPVFLSGPSFSVAKLGRNSHTLTIQVLAGRPAPRPVHMLASLQCSPGLHFASFINVLIELDLEGAK